MERYLQQFRESVRKGDMVLLLLCLGTTAFGLLMIASTTNYMHTPRMIIVQAAAAMIGVLLFFLVSSIDLEFISEHRIALTAFSCFLLLLLIPFGTDNGSGNRSWLDIPLVPVDIQPAEICKITYILITASVMASHQNRLSSVLSVVHIVFYLVLIVGLNMFLSGDAGVSLIFVFIFVAMAFAGGVSLFWFMLGGGAIVAAVPILWNYIMDDYQKNRILVLFDPSVDEMGINERYHTIQSLNSLTGGGMTGQGLFNGTRTQTGELLSAQHTDFIFSAIGEELGYVGCLVVMLMLLAIVVRCIMVGVRSQDFMRRLVCFGSAAALIFQILVNVGMCIGVTPVIGLTLPFISYGGSSIVSLYAMLGLVSGVHARPSSSSHERYIHPYR